MLQHFKAINNYEKSNWNYCKQNQLVKWLTCKHNDMTSYLRNWLNTKQNWQQHSTNNSSKGWWCRFIAPALKRLSQADPRVSLVSQCCFTDEGDTLSKDRLQDEWDASVGKMSWSQTWGPLFHHPNQYGGRGQSLQDCPLTSRNTLWHVWWLLHSK